MSYVDNLVATSNVGRISARDRVEVRMFHVGDGGSLVEVWRPAIALSTQRGGESTIMVLLGDAWGIELPRGSVRPASA